jgi:hypothetical protein
MPRLNPYRYWRKVPYSVLVPNFQKKIAARNKSQKEYLNFSEQFPTTIFFARICTWAVFKGFQPTTSSFKWTLPTIPATNGNLVNYKVVDLVKIYKFHIYYFSTEVIRKILKIVCSNKSETCIAYFSAKTASNKQKINYKVVDLVKIYNLCIDHFFIETI